MMVVVRDRFPIWAAIFVVLLVLAAVAIVIYVITGGRATVLVVAIPGFPLESIVIGLMVGLISVVLKHRSVRNADHAKYQREC